MCDNVSNRDKRTKVDAQSFCGMRHVFYSLEMLWWPTLGPSVASRRAVQCFPFTDSYALRHQPWRDVAWAVSDHSIISEYTSKLLPPMADLNVSFSKCLHGVLQKWNALKMDRPASPSIIYSSCDRRFTYIPFSLSRNSVEKCWRLWTFVLLPDPVCWS